MTIDDFLNAIREVKKLRWPVVRPVTGLPAQRIIGEYSGQNILWPVSGATLETLRLAELNGIRYLISHESPISSSLKNDLKDEIEACIALARRLDGLSQHIRELQRQSIEILEREAEVIMLAGLVDTTSVSECLLPLVPLAVRIRKLHCQVPTARIYDLVSSVSRREIYPAVVSIKAGSASPEIEVRLHCFRHEWIAIRCPAYHREQTNIYPVFINEEKETYLDASISIITYILAEIVYTPEEAISLMRRLDFLAEFFSQEAR